MRRLLLLVPAPARCLRDRPAAGGDPGSRRDAGPHLQRRRDRRFIGQQGTSETGAADHAARPMRAVLRWAPPGMMLTMEYQRRAG